MSMTPRLLRTAAALAVALAACTPSKVYRPPHWALKLEIDESFDSVAMLDAERVVFSHSRGSFRYVDPDPLWGKGSREFVRDEHVVGVYDVAGGEGEVVYSYLRDRLGDGNGELRVVQARGGFALVYRERETVDGILHDAGGWSLLSLDSGAIERLNVDEDLAPYATELASTPRLVDDQGTLLLTLGPTEGATARMLLRRAGGELMDLGLGRFSGELDGRLFVARPGTPGAEAVDTLTGARETLDNRALSEVGSARFANRTGATVYLDSDRQGFVVYRGSGDERVDTPVTFKVADLR